MSENSAPRKLSRGKIALIAAVVAVIVIAVHGDADGAVVVLYRLLSGSKTNL